MRLAMLTYHPVNHPELQVVGSRPRMRPVHFVYIVRCNDGTFYRGYAPDPRKGAKTHNDGKGAKYTSGRRPVRLVYSEACETRNAALKREHQLKGLSRSAKEALVRSALPD